MRCLFLVLLPLILALNLGAATPEERAAKELADKLKVYTDTPYGMLRAAPEEYKNKKVSYGGRFLGFTVNFMPYIEKSGFEASKYFGVTVADLRVPVMAKKNDDWNELFGTVLKPGMEVRVYGKIKQFRHDPELTTMPRYYLELSYLEITEKTVTRRFGREQP